METCKHKNKKRLYERGESWKSTHLYKCQDCGKILKIGFEEVKPNQLNKEKTLPEKTKDALNVKEEKGVENE